MVSDVDALCFIVFLALYAQTFQRYGACTQDQTSSRPNTLSDDADDIQRQLDNEAQDRILHGRPKTIWVIHFPTHLKQFEKFTPRPGNYLSSKGLYKGQRRVTNPQKQLKSARLVKWRYNQQDLWSMTYPYCAGYLQSPVDLPEGGYPANEQQVSLKYFLHDLAPWSMKLGSDGQRVIMTGNWRGLRPNIQGGVVSRKYWFHSLVLHWPSEHTVGGQRFPVESQALYVSSDYEDFESALRKAPKDRQAMLGIVTLYDNSNETDPGLNTILRAATQSQHYKSTLRQPLDYFNPPLLSYASYQGSLTVPPCYESVLWLVRSEVLSVSKNNIKLADSIISASGEPITSRSRVPQQLSGRDILMFKNIEYKTSN